MRMHLSWLAFLLAGLACAVPGIALAQSYTYSIYVDNDANSGTGCTENGFGGAEVRLQVTTSTGNLPAILTATQSVCTGGAFGPAAPLSGGAALGFDTGLSGADVIELAADESLLRAGSSSMRLGAVALSARGSDQLYGSGPQVPVIGGTPVPIPLLGVPMLALLVLLLLVVGARRARRWRVVAMLISLAGTAWAANFVVDGQTQDWAGMAPLATDPAGDATSGEQAIDLLALFGAAENGRIFLRLDVANLQASPPGGGAVAVTTREDTPVTLTLTGSDAQGAALTFAIASAPAHGTLGALTPSGPTSATVEYTPNPDVNGSDSFTYTVANGQGVSAPATANVTITPVNDAPQFTAQNPPAVDENAGPQTATVATAIAAGPPTAVDEATQVLDFIVTANDNPALFAAPPTISAAGVLSYEPAANANGTATLGVVLHDDGGTLDGGVDTSAPQQITVTVNAVDNVPAMTAGGTLAYIENDPPAAVDAGVTVSDIDSTTLAGATVRISAGYQSGADVLAFAGTPTISASFDAATGRLSLAGVDTVANYQAALRAVTYFNSSDDPDAATRTVTWQANDGTGNSAPVTSTITVTPVNDPATIVAGGTLAYVEGDPPTPVDVTVTVTDPDNAVLVGASVQISANYGSGEDVLAFAPAGGITGVFDAATGTLTLNGSAPLATYQAALRAVTYVNTSVNPSKATRTVAWQVNDGTDPSNIATSTITVTGVDNAPVITAGGTLAYTENDPPTPIDPTLTVVDADSAVLTGAVVQVSANYQNGADVLGFAATATITGAWNAASATLTLSGADSPAAYQAALRSVTFVNTSNDPSVAPRTIRFTASDGTATSVPATSTVTVTAINDPPVLSGGAAVTYTEDDPPTVVDATLAVADPDNTTLAGATVQISANYVPGEDVLAFTSAGAITGSFLPATGVLTLSGVDTLANYAAALRSVTYSNTSQNPAGVARGVSFQVSDGAAASNVVASTITVVPVNDAPVLTAGAAVSYTEGAPAVVADPALTVTDVDSPTLAGASVRVTGNFIAAQDVLAFTPVGAITGSYDGASGTLTLGGADTPANYQAALRSVTYRNTSQNPSTGTRTLSWSASDGMATSAVVTSTVAVISINSAPVFTVGADQTVLEDAGAQTVAAWASAIGDGDGGGQALTFEVTGNTNPGLFSAAPAVSATGTLTYTPAPDANGSATITLVLHDDGGTANGGVDTSAPQTFTITVTPVNDAPSFVKGADVSVLQDLGPQTINPWATSISAGPTNESAQNVSFSITGNTNPALFSAAPTVSASGALSFTAAPNATGSATITLVARDDGGTANGGVDTSAPQTFTITVVLVNHAPTFVAGGNVSVNEDSGAYSAAWATGIDDGDAGVTQALDFIVSNDNAALFSVQPSLTPSGTLSFTPAPDANGSAQVTVRLHDDGGTANGGVDTSAPQTFTITVTPVNDAPSFVKGADVSVLQDLGPQTIDPWATAISAGPPNESGQSVSFIVTGNTNPALFAVAPTVSASGALSFTSAPNATGSATITLVAHDDGGTANGGVDTSAPQTFTITVVLVNHAPTFVAGGNVSVNEDSGAYSAAWATAIDDGDAAVTQALDFIVSNDNPALFAVQPSITPTGTLSFTPAPDANGTAQVTVRLHDDGGTANGGVDTSAPQTFTITVNPVNDAPSFVKGADVSVLQDLGPQTINPWATAISAGPPNESAQSVSFTVTGNTNPALFAAAPVVSASGALSFTSAPNTSGSATITLVARDDGGTANGGVDTSAPQTFTITVLFVNQAPSFVSGGNVSVNEDSGPYSAPWASAIDDGNAGVTQALDFIVGNDNNALFSVQPLITPTGTLSFTPAPDANGSAQVTVRLHDDGGTANGGVDTSAPQTFTITVIPVNDAPVAVPHALKTHSGISITIGAGDSERLKDGATDVDDPFGDLRVSPTFTNITPAGATVTLLDPVVGTYRYDPPAGYHGPASFDYTVCDDGIPTPPVQCGSATVTVDITGPDLWFVDSSAAAGGSGRLSAPFNSLAALPGTRGNGDKVFVFAGDYASGHLLNDSEELVGAGASGAFDTLLGVVVPANGTLAARPTLGGTAPTIRGTVTMANASKVQGVAIASGSSTGLFATGKTGLRVSETSVVSAGAAIDISSSSAAASGVTLTSTTSSGGANGIRLASISGGAFNLGTGSLSGNSAAAFTLATGSANVSYAGSITATGAARPVDISGVSGGATTVALSGAITAANGIRVANSTGGTITFSGASQALTTTTNTAVDLATNTGATVNFSGGGLVIKTTSGAGFKATGGGTVTVTGTGNSVASGSGVGVTVQNTSIGASGIRFQSVATDAAANGILLASSGSGPFVVDGGTSDPTNTTRGRITAAQGGGTFTLGAGGTINASTGAGVRITNAGGSVTLRNMVVQGGAAEGVRADGVAGLVLDNTRVAGHADFSGIAGTNVSGLTLQHVEVQGNGTSVNAATNHNWGIRFGQVHTCGTGCADGLVGTALVANSLITNSAEYVFGIENANASVLNLTLANNQISDTGGAPVGAFGFSAHAWNNANISITATGNLFRNTRSNAFSYLGDDSSGGGTINLSGNQFANNGVDAAIAHQGLGKTVTVTMDNNVTRQTLVAGSSVSLSAITGGVSNGATVLRGSMSGNTVGNSTIADSGSALGAGIGIEARGPGTVTLRANNNIVRSIGQDYAMYVSANSDTTGSNRLNLTATGNTLNTNPSASAFGALAGFGLASGGNGGGDNTHVCAHLTGNVSYIGDAFYFGAELLNLAAASDIALEGYGGSANNVSALSAFITGTATTVTPAPSVVIGAGTIKPAAGACPTAP